MGSKQSSKREVEWRSRLARFHREHLTVAEFCRREGISTPSFYQWKKRLKEEPQRSRAARRSGKGSAAASKSNRFVAVNVSSAAVAEVEFPNGVRVRVPAANAEALRMAILAGGDICREARSC
jgi:hypothetical protein